jgi:NhaA family Na+:H+ antiporter
VQEFLQTSTASASLLFLAVIAALVWANSPWKAGYEALFSTELTIRIGSLVDLDGDLHFWVNDGLMALFFLVVGLEIKREVVSGELQLRVATLLIMAAIGGMVAPALIYLAVAGGGETGRGWGIPMATDIAFALGVLALAASYASPRLKPLLLTLAIVDDIGAIIVIAIFYTGGVDATALIAAFGIVGLIAIANAVHIRFILLYVLLGAALWYATYRAGIHPTIAGVVLGAVDSCGPVPASGGGERAARRTADETSDDPQGGRRRCPVVDAARVALREAVSPLVRPSTRCCPGRASSSFRSSRSRTRASNSLTRLGDSLTAPVSVGIFSAWCSRNRWVLVGSFITVRTGWGAWARTSAGAI